MRKFVFYDPGLEADDDVFVTVGKTTGERRNRKHYDGKEDYQKKNKSFHLNNSKNSRGCLQSPIAAPPTTTEPFLSVGRTSRSDHDSRATASRLGFDLLEEEVPCPKLVEDEDDERNELPNGPITPTKFQALSYSTYIASDHSFGSHSSPLETPGASHLNSPKREHGLITPPESPLIEQASATCGNNLITSLRTAEQCSLLITEPAPLYLIPDVNSTALTVHLDELDKCSKCAFSTIDTLHFSRLCKYMVDHDLHDHEPVSENVNAADALKSLATKKVIALVAVGEDVAATTKFYALRGGARILRHASLTDVLSYQHFHKENIKISCQSPCSLHGRGHVVWTFAQLDDPKDGKGLMTAATSRKIARDKARIMRRKRWYHLRR